MFGLRCRTSEVAATCGGSRRLGMDLGHLMNYGGSTGRTHEFGTPLELETL